MGRKKNRRYRMIFGVLLFSVFLTIVLLHSYNNLQDELKGPSEGWGRNISLNEIVPYKKAPSIHMSKDTAEVLTTDGKTFINSTIDRKTSEFSKQIIDIEASELNKIVKYEWNKEFIFWMENFTLYYSSIKEDGSYSPKILLADEIRDFQILKSEGICYIIVAKHTGISLYEAKNASLSPMGDEYPIKGAEGASLVLDKSGTLHIAAFANENSIVYPINYLTFKDGKWRLIAEKTEKQLSRGFSLSGIEIGIDDTDAYIFYKLTKWDTFGASAKINYAVYPLASSSNELSFEKFYLFEDEKDKGSTYICEPICIKEQNDSLGMTVVKDTRNIKGEEGNAVFYFEMDNGEVKNISKATLDRGWIPNVNTQKIDDSLAIAFIDTAGKARYEILYTENSDGFKEAVSRVKAIDLLYAALNIIPGYVIASFFGLVRLLTYIPAVAWLLIVEFFEIRKLRKRPMLVFNIAVLIHIVVKLFAINSYYTPISIQLMPGILKFTGASYVFAIGIIAISYLLTKLYKKSSTELNYIAEYFIFAFIDIYATLLLYTGYMI